MQDKKMEDMQSVPYTKGCFTKCLRVINVFMILAKYCYNTTYLFTVKAYRNPIIFQILISHNNTIIVMKLCQMKQQ